MPIEFEIDPAKGIVRSEAHGVLRGDELVEFARHLFTAPDLPSPYRGLCDLTRVTEFEGSVDAIRRMADLARGSDARAPGGRLALVTGSANLYGLSRMYEMLSTSPDFEVRVFEQDVAAALRWLTG